MQASMRVASCQSAFVASSVAPARRMVLAPARVSTVEVMAGNGKLKTRKSAAKRFKVTGGGKVMARSAGKQHFNEKMSRDDIRDASKLFTMSTANLPQAIKCLPNSGIGGKH